MTAIRKRAWRRLWTAGPGLILLMASLAGNPALAVERREIDIAKGNRRQAGIYPFNPELEVEGEGGVGRARGPVEEDPRPRRSTSGVGVGLSQTPLWVQGQRGLKVRAAEAGLARAEHQVADARRLVLADVVKAYGDLLVSQARQERSCITPIPMPARWSRLTRDYTGCSSSAPRAPRGIPSSTENSS